MIQKIIITILIFFVFIFGVRFLKKIQSLKNQNNNKKTEDEIIVDLEKDPKTNVYKPKKQLITNLILEYLIINMIDSLLENL